MGAEFWDINIHLDQFPGNGGQNVVGADVHGQNEEAPHPVVHGQQVRVEEAVHV